MPTPCVEVNFSCSPLCGLSLLVIACLFVIICSVFIVLSLLFCCYSLFCCYFVVVLLIFCCCFVVSEWASASQRWAILVGKVWWKDGAIVEEKEMPPHCKVEILFCHRNNPQMANMASQTDNVWTWSDLVVAKHGDGGEITQKCHLCDQRRASNRRWTVSRKNKWVGGACGCHGVERDVTTAFWVHWYWALFLLWGYYCC